MISIIFYLVKLFEDLWYFWMIKFFLLRFHISPINLKFSSLSTWGVDFFFPFPFFLEYMTSHSEHNCIMSLRKMMGGVAQLDFKLIATIFFSLPWFERFDDDGMILGEPTLTYSSLFSHNPVTPPTPQDSQFKNKIKENHGKSKIQINRIRKKYSNDCQIPAENSHLNCHSF